MRGGTARRLCGGRSAEKSPVGESTVTHRRRAASCGCAGDGRDIIHRTRGNVGCLEQRDHGCSRPAGKVHFDPRFERRSIRDAQFVRGEPRIVGERGIVEHHAAEAPPFAIGLHGEHHLAVAHRYAPYGTTMLCRTPARRGDLPVPCYTFSGGIIHSVMHSNIEMSIRSPRPVLRRG